jgi:hypothetical protein
MASYGGPILDSLDVIEHDISILQISSGLHSFDQVHPGSGPHFGYLENKHLIKVRALSRELVLLNIGPVATTFENGDAVHDPNLRIYLNAVTSFLMLGELIYLHFSRIGTSSSRSYFLTSAPLDQLINHPRAPY